MERAVQDLPSQVPNDHLRLVKRGCVLHPEEATSSKLFDVVFSSEGLQQDFSLSPRLDLSCVFDTRQSS